MRTVAATTMGIAVAAVMAISVPWGLGTYGETYYYSSDSMGFAHVWFLAIYLAIPAALLTAILVAILGVRASGSHERAVLAALGETAGTGIRRAALIGLRDGGIAAGLAYTFMGAMHLAVESANGWPSFTTETTTWGTRAVEALVGVVALTVAHVISAWRRNRTPVQLSRESVHAYRRPRTGRVGLIAATILAASSGLIAGLALTHGTETGGFASTLADVAYAAAWVAIIALALTAVLPRVTLLAFRGVGAAGRVAARLGSTQLAAVLRTRSADPTRAAARVILILGTFGFAIGALATTDTGVRHSDSFAFLYTENPSDPVEAVGRIEAIDGVTAVVPADVVGLGADGWTEVIAVDPADLAGVDDEIASALQDHPGAALATTQGVDDVATALDQGGQTYRPDGIVPLLGYGLAYVDSTQADLGSAGGAYFVYVSNDADRDAIADELTGSSPDAVNASQALHFANSAGSGGSSLSTWLFWIGAVFLVLAPIAFTAVRAGSRDAAVLTALGSPSRAVRTAVAIEGTIVGFTAASIGVATGILSGALTEVLDRAGRSIDGVITDSYLGVAFDSINWGTSLGFIAVVGLAYAVLATVVANAVHLETPAEALREGTVAR